MEKPDTPPSPGQPSPKQPRPLKRKRAAVACDSCRVRKLKCDNGRPVCGRCQGYDFQCTWTGQRRSDADGQTSSSPSVDQRLALVNEACADFAEETRLKVSSLLDCISACVSEQRLSMRAKDHDDTGTDAQIQSQTTRYVGELSDIHFLSLSRSRLDFSSTGSIDNSIETYDQECVKQPALPPQEFAADMPCSEECQGYLETYFSTIHIAYPFIPKSIFMKRFQSLFAQPAAKGPDEGHVTKAWLALFYTVLALGVHHRRTLDTALGDSKASLGLHATLFRKALALTDLHNLEATTVQVSALLARCFYLLATSQTDRCWVCLGVAVRLAQSLGMHVSHVESQPKQWGYGLSGLAQAEVRSRNWFCLFVLDQLLALQLGRPSITGPETFCVPLPIAIDDSTLDWNTDDLEQAEVPDQSLGDYFLHIIQFSKIVRLVVTELSIPQRSTGNKLASVASWDAQLQKWKHQLPRHLQFYVGQVFDKKMLFRRQRNMLAIKYHHIRTLIHRPFLELPCDMGTPIVGEEIEVAVRLGEICLYEARSTMHLFHNIQDVGEIVHDFPWWQIISCLLCAGTVLVVSSATDRDDTQELLSEAEACLKILEVLGGISQGARIAQNMLNKLLNRASSAPTNRAVYGYGPGSADTVENGLKFPTETPQEMGRVLPLAYHQPWEQLNHGADTQWLNDPSLIWPFDSLLWSQEVLNSMNPTSAAADDVGTR